MMRLWAIQRFTLDEAKSHRCSSDSLRPSQLSRVQAACRTDRSCFGGSRSSQALHEMCLRCRPARGRQFALRGQIPVRSVPSEHLAAPAFAAQRSVRTSVSDVNRA